MFTEAYFIFSVGNLKGLWKKAYPDCFAKTDPTCSTSLIDTLTYTQARCAPPGAAPPRPALPAREGGRSGAGAQQPRLPLSFCARLG